MALSAWKFQLPAAASILKTASGGLLVEDRSKGKVAGVGRFLFQMKEILKWNRSFVSDLRKMESQPRPAELGGGFGGLLLRKFSFVVSLYGFKDFFKGGVFYA